MPTKSPDMTQREFDAACERRGFVSGCALGYYHITKNISVSVWNAGRNATRREQLKYLIAEHKKAEAKTAVA
jgi:hypothetical protein